MYWVDTLRSASTPTDSLQRTRRITRKPRATFQRGNTKAGEVLAPRLSWRSETGYAETYHVFQTSAIHLAESMGKRGCWWRDSNPQGLSPRDVTGLCVYQF